MADIHRKEFVMEVIISLIISVAGAHFGQIDFFILFTCVSAALSLYRDWITYTNDKTAQR